MTDSTPSILHEDHVLKGVGASPGVVIGPVFLLHHDEQNVLARDISDGEIPREIERLEEALDLTRQQLNRIQERVFTEIGPESAGIFDAHLLVVDDRSFIDEIIRGVEQKKKNVDIILQEVCKHYTGALERMDDEYLRERAVDIRDVTRRIAENLTGRSPDALATLEVPSIVVASDLSPSDTAMLDKQRILGLATDHGSLTSHVAILARALDLPAVVSLHDVTIRIRTGENAILDGNKGLFIPRPLPEEVDQFLKVSQSRRLITAELEQLVDQPAEMRDGYRVMLSANIELPNELPGVMASGAKGIGLFRTEFLYLSQGELPDEEAQYKVYQHIAQSLFPEPVILRTLDLGGDKFLQGHRMASEVNPFLGWRAIRFCLDERELFKIQLRAMVRASEFSNVHIMLPFISDVQEVRDSLDLLEEVREEIRKEGRPFAEEIPVGVMIEVPSAALTAEIIAPWVDFFSIGTNDLVQYTLAVDRNNERISRLYQPTHLSVLKLIRSTIDIAHANGIWAGICGEMAGDPLMAPLLIGMGADELSVTPSRVSMVKRVIRNLRYSRVEALADEVERQSDAKTVVDLCRNLVREVSPELLDLL